MRRRQKIRIGLTLGAASGLGLTAAGCGGDPSAMSANVTASFSASQSPETVTLPVQTETTNPAQTSSNLGRVSLSPSPETPPHPSSSPIRYGRVVLGRDNFCAWTPSNAEPLVSSQSVQDDGRCNYPEANVDPWNPANDPQKTGIDVLPQFGSGHAAEAADGTILYINCVTQNNGDGGSISDANGNASRWWLQVNLAQSGLGTGIGYVPEVNAGYDAQALLAAQAVGVCAQLPAGILK